MGDYQLIALDMDGTLLSSRKEITPRTREMIARAAQAGKHVALCTGRCIPELRDYTAQLPDVRYAVCTSGAQAVELRDMRVLDEHGIAPEVAGEILDACRGEDVMIHLLTTQSIVRRDQVAQMARYQMGVYRGMFERVTTQVDDVAAWLARNPVPVAKINLYHTSPQSREQTRARLACLPLELADSEIASLECSALGVTKGTGLERLCRALGLSISQAIAVGDADNDLDVLRRAGLAVAMGNANARVKAIAGAMVADCDHDGCAEAIERFLL